MDRLTLVIAVSDVLLNRYGTGADRARRLSAAFGAQGAKDIQAEVNRALTGDLEARYMAVACIAGHYGKNPERAKALGRWADKAQAAINAIYAMRGKTTEQAAKDVINGNYDKDTVRELLLTFCGYTPGVVQDKVNQLLAMTDTSTKKFRIHAEHFFRKDEKQYGDCTAIYQYGHAGKVEKCVLIDCAKDSAADVVISDLKAQGVKQIDAMLISHAHGDHYGGFSKVCKAFPVKWLYLPDTTELDKYQKGYGGALRRQAEKVQNARWLKMGDSFQIGEIKGKNIFMCKASKLSDHDNHYFVNNMSMSLRFYLGKAVFDASGDMQNPANTILTQTVANLGAHIAKLRWHGDGNALNNALAKALTRDGKVRTLFFSNYHHKESQGNRQATRKKCEKYGGIVYRNHEDGQIYFDISGDKITVTTSKSGKHDTYTIKEIPV